SADYGDVSRSAARFPGALTRTGCSSCGIRFFPRRNGRKNSAREDFDFGDESVPSFSIRRGAREAWASWLLLLGLSEVETARRERAAAAHARVSDKCRLRNVEVFSQLGAARFEIAVCLAGHRFRPLGGPAP